jgi:hypothetical protein
MAQNSILDPSDDIILDVMQDEARNTIYSWTIFRTSEWSNILWAMLQTT